MVRYDRFHTKRDVSNTRFSGAPTAFHFTRSHSLLPASDCSLSLSLGKIYITKRRGTLKTCPRMLSRTLQIGYINTRRGDHRKTTHWPDAPIRPIDGPTYHYDYGDTAAVHAWAVAADLSYASSLFALYAREVKKK